MKYTLSQAAADSHSRHNCAEHDHEKGSSPVHSFLSKGIPSSVYPRVRHTSMEENKACYNMLHRSNSFSGYGSLEMPHEKGKPSHGHRHRQLHDHLHEHDHKPRRPPSTPGQHEDMSYLLNDDGATKSHGGMDHSHSHSHGRDSGGVGKSPRAVYAAVYTFWMALVVHSTMEGFGIGVADTFLEQATLVMAILIHKVFESLALASLLLDIDMPPAMGLAMYGTFTVATPLGALFSSIVESYVVEGNHVSSKVISGVITGMASGSFM